MWSITAIIRRRKRGWCLILIQFHDGSDRVVGDQPFCPFTYEFPHLERLREPQPPSMIIKRMLALSKTPIRGPISTLFQLLPSTYLLLSITPPCSFFILNHTLLPLTSVQKHMILINFIYNTFQYFYCSFRMWIFL